TLVCKQIYSLTDDIYRTQIDTYEHGDYPDSIEVFNKKACMHCTEALCVISCPTGAMYKNDDGLTVYDERICISCNHCVANCPFGVITFDRTRDIMEKCTFCDKRVENGLEPFCYSVCSPQAIKYGSRPAMIAAGNQRVQLLKDQGFEEANLYGVDEFGGLRVLLVLQYTPDKYNLPAETEVPMGKQIFKYLISPFGGVAAFAAIGALIYNYASNKKGSA
ncbi:MAG: 4Fe-4S dicluster domain-containing protein, partial [Bacillota bacterium]